MDESEMIGANVRRLREEQGLTQADLALRLTERGVPGMHPQTITKIEAGSRALKFTEALELASILHVSPQHLRQLPEEVVAAQHLAREVDEGVKALLEAEEAVYMLECMRAEMRRITETTPPGKENKTLLKMARGLLAQTPEKVIERARSRIAFEAAADDLSLAMRTDLLATELMSSADPAGDDGDD